MNSKAKTVATMPEVMYSSATYTPLKLKQNWAIPTTAATPSIARVGRSDCPFQCATTAIATAAMANR